MGLTALLDGAPPVLAQIAAGLRLALVLFAAMALLARVRPQFPVDLERWFEQIENAHLFNARAWMFMSIAALCFSPLQTALLLGRPAPPLVARIGDVAASALGCASFIHLLAARGSIIGLSAERIRRGILTNVVVAFLVVVMTWLTR